MTVTCYKNGNQIELNDPFDIEYIEYDVVNDYLKTIGYLENNPSARVEIDFSEQLVPKYKLVNCSNVFVEKFNQVINQKKLA